MKPDFPEVIDSTLMGNFRSCPQKAFRMYFEHWKPQSDSIHLHAGKAFARGLEIARIGYYDLNLPHETAVTNGMEALMAAWGDFPDPADGKKTLERMMGALDFYFINYPMNGGKDHAHPHKMPSGRHAIEFSFAQPLPILHPVTGNPLIYAGRSDMICDYAGGVYIEDDKTASQLGASWLKQWDLRSQFIGYSWAAKESAIPVNGVLVRGVSILKTKYDTLEALVNISQWEIDRWLGQVVRDLGRMIRCWEEGYWDWNLDHACSEYGGCPLQIVCKSPSPESWLPMYFKKRIWDPLLREERDPAMEVAETIMKEDQAILHSLSKE